MKLTTTLMWYDEPVEELSAQVRALGGFAHRLVAVDGAWGPPKKGAKPFAKKPTSPPEQAEAIREAAKIAGLELVLHVPTRHWKGEVEHRSFTLEAALADRDTTWIYLMDADERVVHWRPDLHDRLASTDYRVGTVKFKTLPGPHAPATKWEKPGKTSEERRLFKVAPDLRYDRRHFCLRGTYPEGELALWGSIPGVRFARAEFLQIEVEHRTCLRTDERWARKWDFIPVRDAADDARGFEW